MLIKILLLLTAWNGGFWDSRIPSHAKYKKNLPASLAKKLILSFKKFIKRNYRDYRAPAFQKALVSIQSYQATFWCI